MKQTKKLLAIILAVIIMISAVTVTAVNVSAAAGDKIYCRASFTPYCYMWKKNTEENNKQWPGEAMTKVSGESDLYCYTVPQDKFNMVIFNNGGNGNQTADMDYPGANKLYDYASGTWSDYAPVPIEPVPSISVSPESGSFKTTIDVTITVTDANSAYYTIDGGRRQSFSGSKTVTLGKNTAEGAAVTLYVSATNTYGTVDKSCTYKKKTSSSGGNSGNDGSTSPAIGGNYATNPNGGYGARKTITVDGDKSDWDSSMLIAQGVANDDPRVYAHWSMHEKGIDDYAMYAAWDNDNLYIMYEMANVQDIVAPGEDFPMTQGNLWIDNLPVFMYIYTGEGNVTHNQTAGGTLWNTGTTIDANSDHVIAYSTNASNGPFIYTANDNGELEPDVLVKKGAQTGIKIEWGNGKTLSGKLMGIPKAGTDNKRTPGDCVDGALTDFYAAGHKASMDMFYEISIPLKNLDITASDIETNGIGVMKVSTFGTSGMDCLPYDLSMSDNAAKPYSKDASTSAEKEDEDHITVPMARVGAALSGGGDPVTPTNPPVVPTEPPTQAPTVKPTDPPVKPTDSYENPTDPGTAGSVLLGDADNDKTITVLDATTIQRKLVSLSVEDYNKAAADVDRDGTVTILDATGIQRFLVSLSAPGGIGRKV